MRSVMGSLKRVPKCPRPWDAKVRARRHPAPGHLLRGRDRWRIYRRPGLLVEDQVIAELKGVAALSGVHIRDAGTTCGRYHPALKLTLFLIWMAQVVRRQNIDLHKKVVGGRDKGRR
jgi:hypothetical protein